jgi:3-oxoacyl-[acyl-carrier protein] reductase
MEIPRRLVNRVAVVTGAGHGIGKAYARRLAQEGARVVIAELDGAAGENAATELRGNELEVMAVPTDVADAVSVQRMVDQTVKAYGGLDILVNNAAIFVTVPMSRSTFDQIDPDEWDRMMKVNLKGVWFCCRAAVPVMRQRGYGKIVNISSGTVFKGAPTRIHYVTTKAGIVGFTRTLARELGADGITVNCIAPGSTLSETEPDEETLRFRTAAARERAISRVQEPEDLVGAMAFFASPDSDFITGQTLLVDGGAVMH